MRRIEDHPSWRLRLRQDGRGCSRLALGSMVLLLAFSSAQAQINPFRGSRGTRLNMADLTALGNATTRLLERPGLAAGGTETWRNPESGASGSITAGEALQHEGMACRELRYEATVPGPAPYRKAVLTWCKTKDGWKVL